MDLSKLNYFAILAAAVSSFVIGGVWYSPILFGSAWMKAAGLSEQEVRTRKMGIVFSVSFLLSLVISFNLAAFLAGPPNLTWGITAGALAGIGWVSTAMGITYLFEARSPKLFLVNAGYHAVTFMVMGGILGVWK
jgi:uncharacterized membrane protein YbjE (DUF340 family)